MRVIKDRLEIIKKHIEGKSVLDMGCIDHNAMKEQEEFWLHRFIKENSKYVLGVDIDAEQAEKLKEKGYEIVCADVVTMDLKKRFDVAVAGELIEHLSNPGLFLFNTKRHLKDDGKIILTTPNVFALRRLVRLKLGMKIQSNPEHCCWYDHDTLKTLLERHHLKIIESYYFLDPHHSKVKYFFELIAAKLNHRLSPYMIFVAEKNE